MLNYIKQLLLILFALILTSCESGNKNTLRVGVISGPETELMEVAKEVAKNKYNLDIEIVEFTDYVQPNAAVNDGTLDVNVFQHKPFLDQQIHDRHYDLVPIGKTFVYPMGVYSQKIKNLSELKSDAEITLPNDPSNEGRALLLLQKAGIIKLKNAATIYATPEDIQNNAKHFKFKELDAAQVARSLPDVDIAVINTNYAVAAGLSPTKNAIYHEGSDSPYANIIVVRKDKTNDPRIKQLIDAIHSPEVLKAAEKIFNDQAIPAWQH